MNPTLSRSNSEASIGVENASANRVECKEEIQTQSNRDAAARQVVLGLLASLVVALPGYAQEFRGNPASLGGTSKTADASAGIDGTSGAATLSIPIAVPPGPGGLAPTLSLGYSSDRGDGPFGLGWDL